MRPTSHSAAPDSAGGFRAALRGVSVVIYLRSGVARGMHCRIQAALSDGYAAGASLAVAIRPNHGGREIGRRIMEKLPTAALGPPHPVWRDSEPNGGPTSTARRAWPVLSMPREPHRPRYIDRFESTEGAGRKRICGRGLVGSEPVL